MKNDIVKYLKKNIASYKWPKIVDFAKELPKTISGKIRRAEIKQGDWNEEGSEEEIKPQNVSDEAATDESAVEEKEGSIDE